jgi:hypothetical protein
MPKLLIYASLLFVELSILVWNHIIKGHCAQKPELLVEIFPKNVEPKEEQCRLKINPLGIVRISRAFNYSIPIYCTIG